MRTCDGTRPLFGARASAVGLRAAGLRVSGDKAVGDLCLRLARALVGGPLATWLLLRSHLFALGGITFSASGSAVAVALVLLLLLKPPLTPFP